MKLRTFLFCAVFSMVLLSACARGQWVVPTNLTPEERSQYQSQIKTLEQQIKVYQPKPADENVNPPLADFVDLARAYEALGDYKGALKTYQHAIELHKKSEALDFNLGRLYDKAQDYQSAAQQYQMMIKKYREDKYYYDLTWSYIHAEDLKNAQKAFNNWQNLMHRTDEETQIAIKRLMETK